MRQASIRLSLSDRKIKLHKIDQCVYWFILLVFIILVRKQHLLATLFSLAFSADFKNPGNPSAYCSNIEEIQILPLVKKRKPNLNKLYWSNFCFIADIYGIAGYWLILRITSKCARAYLCCLTLLCIFPTCLFPIQEQK